MEVLSCEWMSLCFNEYVHNCDFVREWTRINSFWNKSRDFIYIIIIDSIYIALCRIVLTTQSFDKKLYLSILSSLYCDFCSLPFPKLANVNSILWNFTYKIWSDCNTILYVLPSIACHLWLYHSFYMVLACMKKM